MRIAARIIRVDGGRLWSCNRRLHRQEGPAVIDGDYQAWYRHGERHRLDGPAYITSRFQAWYRDDYPHRLDGPAKIWHPNEVEEYYVGGKLCHDHGEYAEEVKAYIAKTTT